MGGIINREHISHFNGNLYHVKKIDGTHSYILNHRIFDVVANQMLSLSSATDGEYEILRNNKSINSFIFLPFFTYQSDEYSFICDAKKDLLTPTKQHFRDLL